MRRLIVLVLAMLLLGLSLAACTETPEGVEPELTGAPALPEETEVSELPGTGLETPLTGAESPQATTPLATEAVTVEPTEAVTETEEVAATQAVTGTVEIPGTGITGSVQASQLIGQRVVSANNEPLGEVTDLAIRLPGQVVEYVIVKAEGAEDQGANHIPVPWRAFTPASGEVSSLSVGADVLESAPSLDLRAVPMLITEDWDEEFGVFWEEELPAPEEQATPAPEATAPAVTGTPAVTEAPQEAEEEAPAESIVLASTFMDQEVQTPDGEAIGQISDLVIDSQTGEVTFVLLEPGEALGMQDQVIPVPLSALNRAAANLPLTLNLDPEQLQQAPGLQAGELLEGLDPGVQDTIRDFWEQFQQQPRQ